MLVMTRRGLLSTDIVSGVLNLIMVSSEVRLFLPMLHTPVATLGHAASIMLLELLWYKFQIKFINRIYTERHHPLCFLNVYK